MEKDMILVTSGYVAKNKYGYHGSAKRVNIHLTINLDVLSPAARVIATNICTTEWRDDLSNIWVEGPSLRERAVKEGKEKECAECERVCGKEYVEKPTFQLWSFDYLKGYETPEEYFERQVRQMKENGWLKIKHSTFNDNIDFLL